MQTIGCGTPKTAILYYYSFFLVVKLVFLNLFIAVILDGFQVVTVQESRTLNSDLLELMREKWSEFDPAASSYIKISDFPLYMKALGDPIGWGASFNADEKREEFVKELNLPIYNDFKDYQYMDVALALCRRLIIMDEIAVNMKLNPDFNPAGIRMQIEKDLKDLEENDDNISSVKRMNKEQKRLKRQRDR